MTDIDTAFESRFGRLLYELLPAVYRAQDGPAGAGGGGDLARYLDALGTLLDPLRATLEQRLADCFPDATSDGRPSQDWLLPYFARLLDVRLVAPGAGAQRTEVARAMRWRRAKGTLP